MPITAVCIEMRPNLNSGQLFIQFEKPIRDYLKTRLVIKERDVHISENGEEGESHMVLRHDVFGMDIDAMSLFLVTGCHISYHFNYTKVDLEALYNSGGVKVERKPLLLSFPERTEIVALHCGKCNAELVPGCQYNRLREFPTGIVDPTEFFCHSHGAAGNRPSLVPGPSDLYYGLNYIVINMSVIHSRVIQSLGSLHCKRCMWMLGPCILSGAAGKLWADAIRWLPELVGNQATPQPIPRQIFQHSTVTQLMLRLLSSLWPESVSILDPGNNRALLTATMPNRQEHVMIIEVLETQLTTLRGVPQKSKSKNLTDYSLHYYRACKLYFGVCVNCQKLPQWQDCMQVPKMIISPYLFVELQRRFTCNSELIPYAWRYNTFEEKLLLTYFFFENEEEELLHQFKQNEHKIPPTQYCQKSKVVITPEEYETDAGIDGSLDESDDESSDTDTENLSSLLQKSATIIAYEQNLAKRWPKQKHSNYSDSPDTEH